MIILGKLVDFVSINKPSSLYNQAVEVIFREAGTTLKYALVATIRIS